MDIILALECMWVPFFVINALHLDSCVEELVLAAQKVGDLGERLERLRCRDVASHGNLSDRDCPDVQVMQIDDVVATNLSDVFSKLLDVDVLG